MTRHALAWLTLAAVFAAALGGCATTGEGDGGSTVRYVPVASSRAVEVVTARPVEEPAPSEPGLEPDDALEEMTEAPRRARPEKPEGADAGSAEVRGRGHLDRVAPAVRWRGLELHRRLAAEGIHVRFIFGYTPYSKRKHKGPGGWASWHMFGLAFDLNLEGRASMADAKRHFRDDADIWARVGEVARELGLVWGGSWRSSYDPFHFEWHPGDDAVINKRDLARFLRVAGKRGLNCAAVWRLYPDGDSPKM